jgi:hypothetical protein
MKNKVKLLSVALVSAFLVGCGGSSSGKEDTVSLELLKSHFPPFVINATVYKVETDKKYEASDTQIKDFRNVFLLSYAYDDVSSRYFKDGVLPDINATAAIVKNEIKLTLSSSTELESITEDATYKTLFGDVGGDVLQAHIYTTYNEDISSQYTDYTVQLDQLGFICKQTDHWECIKKVDDIHYKWYTDGDNFYGYSAY